MRIIQILVILIWIIFTVSSQNESQKDFSSIHRAKIKLRRFGIFQMRQIREFIRAHELSYKIQVELMKQQEDEMKRRKIYEMHLLYVQPRSNVLRDFHTNRF
jgi:hypothetical protein